MTKGRKTTELERLISQCRPVPGVGRSEIQDIYDRGTSEFRHFRLRTPSQLARAYQRLSNGSTRFVALVVLTKAKVPLADRVLLAAMNSSDGFEYGNAAYHASLLASKWLHHRLLAGLPHCRKYGPLYSRIHYLSHAVVHESGDRIIRLTLTTLVRKDLDSLMRSTLIEGLGVHASHAATSIDVRQHVVEQLKIYRGSNSKFESDAAKWALKYIRDR